MWARRGGSSQQEAIPPGTPGAHKGKRDQCGGAILYRTFVCTLKGESNQDPPEEDSQAMPSTTAEDTRAPHPANTDTIFSPETTNLMIQLAQPKSFGCTGQFYHHGHFWIIQPLNLELGHISKITPSALCMVFKYLLHFVLFCFYFSLLFTYMPYRCFLASPIKERTPQAHESLCQIFPWWQFQVTGFCQFTSTKPHCWMSPHNLLIDLPAVI